jgi:AraC-like DNA-binding protein
MEFSLLVHRIGEGITSNTTREKMDPVSRIKQVMHESCGSANSLEQLCEQVEIPYHTVRKLFRRIEGISLLEYWHHCRLQRAEEQLSSTDKYIFEVAYEMGFSSEGNFTNWFKKHKGMTPREYRQQAQRREGCYSKLGQKL